MNERLERLEQKLAASERRLGRLQIAFALAVVVGLCVGAVRPAVTQEKGTTVKAPFRVVDKEGRTLLNVHVFEGRAALSLLDQDGKSAVSISATADGGGVMHLSNRDGKPAIVMGADDDGGGVMDLSNRDGKRVIVMGAGADGDGGLGVSNRDGKTGITMFATDAGGQLTLLDNAGKVRFKAP